MEPRFPLPHREPILKNHIDDTSVGRNVPTLSAQMNNVKLDQTEQYHSSIKSCDVEGVDRRVKTEGSPHPTNDFIVKQRAPDPQQAKHSKEEEVDARRGEKRHYNSHQNLTSRRMRSSYRSDHHHQLGALLCKFMGEHRWKEAAGVLSVLVKGAPSANNISEEDRRTSHTVAMELHRRSFSSDNRKYEMWIRQIYDIWMSKFSHTRDDSRKKNEILMEMAIFFFTRGNLVEARSMMQLVIQDNDLASRPSVHLLHGMIFYEVWYSGLPEEYKITGFNTGAPVRTFGLASNEDLQEMEIGENSTNHSAFVNGDPKFSSQNASNSSFGNYKVFKEYKRDGPETDINASLLPSRAIPPPQEFYVSHSTDQNEQKPGVCNPNNNPRSHSIFFAHGLDTSLLPIRLNHLTGDIEQIIYEYRRLVDENYSDAVKHLRIALHSAQPVHAALLPLIQLLLLGDRVEEAFAELEKSCHTIDTALPFSRAFSTWMHLSPMSFPFSEVQLLLPFSARISSKLQGQVDVGYSHRLAHESGELVQFHPIFMSRLMARLLECFQSDRVTQICSYCENALKRDPVCFYSLDRLIRMHKSGNYSSMLMFEMIVLHLDAADGHTAIWEELASCFLRIQMPTEYEQYSSKKLQRKRTKLLPCRKIPKAFLEEDARGSWKFRFAWWKRRHFSISSLPEQFGDRKMLCFKAACASHLYGPKYEYVMKVLNYLRVDADHTSILVDHIKNAMNLFEHLY